MTEQTQDYTCSFCGFKYPTEALKLACEGNPLEKALDMQLGTVFKMGAPFYGFFVLYNTFNEQMSHRIVHVTARIEKPTVDLSYKLRGPLDDCITPITDEEFEQAKETLESYLRNSCGGRVTIGYEDDIRTLRELTLTPFKGEEQS